MLWLTLQQLKSGSVRTRRAAVRRLRRMAGPAVVSALTKALRDPEPEVRIDAAAALGEIKGDEVVQPLVEGLTDPDDRVKAAILDALRGLGHSVPAPALVKNLDQGSTQIRWRAAQTLKTLGWQPASEQETVAFHLASGELELASRVGQAAVRPLIRLLKDRSFQQRVKVVNLLSELDHPDITPQLIVALRDPDSLVRTASASGLGARNAHDAVPALILLLRDADSHVRASAAESLGWLGDPAAVDPLLRLLGDRHWEVRVAGLEALGRLRDSRATEAALACLTDPDKEIRQQAAETLGRLGQEISVGPLIRALVDPDSGVRQAAARALSRINPYWERSRAAEEASSSLEAGLQCKDPAVQYAAADALRKIRRQASPAAGPVVVQGSVQPDAGSLIELLVALTSDLDADVRLAAVECLGRLGDASVARFLLHVADDPHPSVREAASGALARMNAPR